MDRFPDILSIGIPIVNIGKLMPMNQRGRTPFGLRMLEARKRAKLTQNEVCERLDLAQSTLSELETTAGSSGRVAEFASLYRCDPLWLATGDGAPESEKFPAVEDHEDDPEVRQIASVYANLNPTERRRFLHLLAAAREDAPVLGDDWGRLWTSRNTERVIEEKPTKRASKRRRLG